MNRRTFLASACGVTAVGVGGAVAFGLAGRDTHEVEVTHVPVRVGMDKPLRVVLMGDIHFDPLYEEKYLARVVTLVNQLEPDLVLMTGDFITAHADLVGRVADILSNLKPRLGTYTVPGNHEHWTGIEFILHTLEQRAGMHILNNRSVLMPEQENVYLTGIDSFWSGKPDLTLFDRGPADARHVVLVHEPDSFDLLTDPRIRLQLSGHTHGGQVRLPIYGAIILPSFGRDYAEGLFTRGQRTLYVNRGIGTLRPHVRINCRPEVTLLDLT